MSERVTLRDSKRKKPKERKPSSTGPKHRDPTDTLIAAQAEFEGKDSKKAAKEERARRVAERLAEARQDYDALRKELNSGVKQEACVSMYSVLLDNILTIIPQARAEIDEDPSNPQMGYLFIALIGTARDLAAEIRSVADLEAQAQVIVSEILMPEATAQMQNLLDEASQLDDRLRAIVQSPSQRKAIKLLFSKVIENHAGMVNGSVRKMRDSIREKIVS